MSAVFTAHWLTRADPLDVFSWMAGSLMLLIALAQWLASARADRLALRIFAARYALAGLGWWLTSPGRQAAGGPISLAAGILAVVLLGITVWALLVFFGLATRRRCAAVAGGTLAGALLVIAYRAWRPADPAAVYGVMMAMMGLCALIAWGAQRREPGVGHGMLAAAFASYPVLMLTAALWLGWDARANLSYLVLLPTAIVGVAILVVSLTRATLRTAAELHRREAAEARLAELNTVLEHRVSERTAELQVMVEGLESFARSISHDLRGSLGGAAQLSRMAEQALAGHDAQRAQRMLQVLTPQLEHLAMLVRELLMLTRLGDAALNRRLQPMEPLVRQALEQLALEPDCAEALRHATVEVGALPELAVDATLMRQVFVNLLGNALRFAASRGGAPHVRVGCAAVAAGDGPAVFVQDNGPGFAPDAASRLFEPFTRLHEPGLSRHGIGLSIVRRIVERHGGRVWAEGRPGQGAVFWVRMPAAA